ncbi:hypothetical protein TFLX_01499 [Thermoflexales bacterium]|nr:hypothetical protein TFLX_01499 [Thermoflexales bacterium]
MKRPIFFVLIGLLLVLASTALAQSGGGYDLTWNTIDGGGGSSNGSGYALVGTSGQSDAGETMTGDGFTLIGGFWTSEDDQHRLYLPLVIRSTSG